MRLSLSVSPRLKSHSGRPTPTTEADGGGGDEKENLNVLLLLQLLLPRSHRRNQLKCQGFPSPSPAGLHTPSRVESLVQVLAKDNAPVSKRKGKGRNVPGCRRSAGGTVELRHTTYCTSNVGLLVYLVPRAELLPNRTKFFVMRSISICRYRRVFARNFKKIPVHI